MSDGVKNLIDAIESGDSMAIDSAFNTELSIRISDKLDGMRQDLAQGMFKEQAVELDEDGEGQVYKESESLKEAEVDKDLNLEDYSVEEIQDFMQTEDFERLDELSKETLSSYVKKAHQSGTTADFLHGHHMAKKSRNNDWRKKKNALSDTSHKREKGINTAVDRLAK